MVYEDVSKILEDNDPELIEKYSDLIDDLRNMEKLYKILNKRREARGSLDFDLDESKITLDIEGKPTDIMPYDRRVSNRIIEEFMLICNETIAEHIYWQQILLCTGFMKNRLLKKCWILTSLSIILDIT